MKPKILILHAIELEHFPLVLPNFEVKTIFTGIGKVNAAMNTMHAVLDFQPDFVLNIGSAGTFNHEVGDIIVSHHFIDRDLQRMNLFGLAYDITTELPEYFHLKSLISGKETIGDFAVNTGDDFVTAGEHLPGDAVDMEVFAAASVCLKMHIPMASVKYITDVVGKNSVAAWEEKLADARAGLTSFFEKNASFIG